MKKIYTIIVTVILFATNAFAQPSFAWAKGMGSASDDIGRSIVTDVSGNIYVTGDFTSAGDFDPGAGVFNMSSAGLEDAFIMKLDAAGNFVWAKRIGSTGSDIGHSITLDGLGNVIVTGEFEGTVDFDPGTGTANMTSAGQPDFYLLKLDPTGNFIWVKTIGGVFLEIGYSVTTDALNNIYTTGSFSPSPSVDFDPGPGVFNLSGGNGFVLKLDASGNFVMAKVVGSGGNIFPLCIKLDAAGSIYTCGRFSLTNDFDPGAGTYNLTSTGSYDVFVSKLDASGNFVWAINTGSTGTDYANALSVDASSNVYYSGQFLGTGDFDPGAGVFNLTSAGADDAFICKLNAAGTFAWAKQIGGAQADVSYANCVDANGNVYYTGFFAGLSAVDLDPGAGTFTLSPFNSDVFISILDPAGNFIWAGQLGGATGTGSDQGFGITVDANGFIHTTGYFDHTGDYDPGPGTFNLSSTPAIPRDIFVHKMAGCFAAPTTPGTISGTTTICSGTTNTYSITAVADATYYTWTLPGGWTGTSTTNSINATASSTSGSITVTANNACGNSTAQTLAITVNTAPATPGTISGLASMCIGTGTQTYSITVVGGATSYTWTLPATWSGTSTTNSIVATPGTSGGNITVTANNTCGNSSPQTLAVIINPLPVVTYSQSPSLVCINATSVILGTVSPTGGTFSGTAVTGSTFNATTAGVGTYSITYTYTDGNGCVNSANSNITVDPCTSVSQNILENEINIYPNPFNSVFTLSLSKAEGQLTIYNILGKLIYSQEIISAKMEIDLSKETNGIYFVKIVSEQGVVTKRIIKQ